MHRRIGPPIAARPVLAGPARRVHACIKTARFLGQVGRGHNRAPGGRTSPIRGKAGRPDGAHYLKGQSAMNQKSPARLLATEPAE